MENEMPDFKLPSVELPKQPTVNAGDEWLAKFLLHPNGEVLIKACSKWIEAQADRDKEENNLHLKRTLYSSTFELIMVGICCVLVALLALTSILDKTSTATLVGAIIGYSLSRLKVRTDEADSTLNKR